MAKSRRVRINPVRAKARRATSNAFSRPSRQARSWSTSAGVADDCVGQ